jgi:hypothetical protein
VEPVNNNATAYGAVTPADDLGVMDALDALSMLASAITPATPTTQANEEIIAHVAANTGVDSPIVDTVNEVIADFFEKPAKQPRRLNYEDHDINTQGHSLTLPIPRGQVVLSKDQHTKTLRDSQL